MRSRLRALMNLLDGSPKASGADSRRGQSVVEMAFITPILIIMVVGIVEIGWFAQNYLNLIEASKVGARRAPFLSGEFGPAGWSELGTLAPTIPLGFTLNPGDPGYDVNPRVSVRGLGPNGCDDIDPLQLGFFNVITCTVLEAMDPLTIRANNKDDIVVSAFSVQKVRIGNTAADDINPNVGPYNSATPYDPGTQLVVVGRYPTTANECVDWNERDPFDWIENGRVDWGFVTNPLGGTFPPVRMVYEVADWNENTSTYDGFLDTADEMQVGFTWRGQRVIETDGVQIGCFGSAWRLSDVERLINLPGFFDGSLPDEEAKKAFLPNVGLVLVEVYWEHTLLLEGFPLLSAEWSPVYIALGGGDPDSTADVIYAWAIFPAPDAEPRLTFKP